MPIGGIVGGAIGFTEGSTIGQIVGGHIGGSSIELVHSGVISPSTHLHTHDPSTSVEANKSNTASIEISNLKSILLSQMV